MNRPDYEALDGRGLPHIRQAKFVGELPTPNARMAALDSATLEVAKVLNTTAVRRIPFGGPVFIAFGFTRPQAKNHPKAKLLLTAGDDLSLDYCPQYN